MKKEILIKQFQRFIELLQNNEISDKDLEFIEDRNYDVTLLIPILFEWNNKKKYPKFNTGKDNQNVAVSIKYDPDLYLQKFFFYKGKCLCIYFGLSIGFDGYEILMNVEEEHQNCFDEETIKLVDGLIKSGFGQIDHIEHDYTVEFSRDSEETFKRVCQFTAKLEELL